jgi:hypothetical protein
MRSVIGLFGGVAGIHWDNGNALFSTYRHDQLIVSTRDVAEFMMGHTFHQQRVISLYKETLEALLHSKIQLLSQHMNLFPGNSADAVRNLELLTSGLRLGAFDPSFKPYGGAYTPEQHWQLVVALHPGLHVVRDVAQLGIFGENVHTTHGPFIFGENVHTTHGPFIWGRRVWLPSAAQQAE